MEDVTDDGTKVNVKLTRSGLELTTNSGFSATFDGNSRAYIVVESSIFKNHVCGLCAKYDGNPRNEWVFGNGRNGPKGRAWGESWLAPGEDASK